MTTRRDEIESQFLRFDSENPEVWILFKRFALEKVHQGHKHYSSKGVFERIRWETSNPKYSPQEFKLNNNYTAFYARRFNAVYPEHDGFFRLREQISHEAPATDLPPLGPGDYTQKAYYWG